MTLIEFVDRLRHAPADQQRRFSDEARDRMVHALHRKQPFARAADVEDAINDTIADLFAGQVSGFVCTAAPDDPAFASSLAGYLAWRIAPNKLVDIYRRTGRERLVGDLVNQSEATDESVFERLLAGSAVASAQDVVDDRQRLARLRHCLDFLPDKAQAVVKLLLGDLRQDEIAERLGIPVGTVKSRLFKALQLLARCMGVTGPAVDAP